MSDENGIGLTELIEQVKQELLSTELGSEGAAPLFSVDEVTLELQVTVRKEAKGGLKIYVLTLGGSASRDDIQKVKVTLTPLVSKQQRLQLYAKLHPERIQELGLTSVIGGLKGSGEDSLDETYTS